MNKLFILPLLMALVLLLGCSMMNNIGIARHESNASMATIGADREKLDAAIFKVTKNAGYEVKETKNTPSGQSYEGYGIKITYKMYKYDNLDRAKLYVSIGYVGNDREKEKTLIADIKKELGEP